MLETSARVPNVSPPGGDFHLANFHDTATLFPASKLYKCPYSVTCMKCETMEWNGTMVARNESSLFTLLGLNKCLV